MIFSRDRHRNVHKISERIVIGYLRKTQTNLEPIRFILRSDVTGLFPLKVILDLDFLKTLVECKLRQEVVVIIC